MTIRSGAPPLAGVAEASGAAPAPWAVAIKDVSVCLGGHRILSNLSAQAPKGGQTVVIGPNGGGKTTLVKSILGQAPFSGEIVFDPPSPRIGYVPQRLNFDRGLPLTVLEFLTLGLSERPLWLGENRRLRPAIAGLLKSVKADHLLRRNLGALSGGELQRVLLASALSLSPELLILDEPATGVDVYGEQLLCELLETFKTRFSILMVSHDLPTARAHADWVICLNRRLIAQGPPEAIFNSTAIAATFGLHSSG
ncbi:MAG: metal ABC transporter ATP-binding protein [Candidatus Adiutrix sp.]|jgi:zinc transport system ATP-binding protein|nr:metal ABC transporter ATP-binding protein [Candidatus Adiutrix sp.]